MNEKLKYILKLTGITGVVYVSFRYLLPLVIPFVFALLFAKAIAPTARWCKRVLHLPEKLAAPIVLLVILAALGTFFSILAVALLDQITDLITSMPRYRNICFQTIQEICCRCDGAFGLKEGEAMAFFQDGMERTGEFVGNQIMPALTGYAGKMIVGVVKAGVSIFIFFIATIMLFGDRKTIREKYSNFPLHDWAALILRKLKNTGFVYMKAQVIIIFIISVVCTLGIYFVGNKYYLLFGITIAIIDAFPVVGSGSILVPWSIFSLLGGNFINAAILFSVYLITMLIREVLEPKLLGDSLGILPVFMLMAIFVGVKLFGVAGIVLGPIGYVIIGTVMKNCNS